IYSTLVFVVAALVAVVLGFSPKFGALIQAIPAPVLGGMSVVVFGLIAIAGARIWVVNQVDFSDNRNLVVAAVTLILGAGNFSLAIGSFKLDGIGTATFGAILLHALLRGRHRPQALCGLSPHTGFGALLPVPGNGAGFRVRGMEPLVFQWLLIG